MSQNDTRVFVAGATGFTGREVVRVLQEHPCETHMHVRPDSTQLPRWSEYAKRHEAHLDTTPWRGQEMAQRMLELAPTHVLALLGTTRSRARSVGRAGGDASLNTYESVDYGLTMELIEGVLALATPPRIIYLSSAGSGPGAKGAYLKVRHRIESFLDSHSENHVTLRPSFITGTDRDEDRPMERVGAAVGGALLSVAGVFGAAKLRDLYSPISNTQLARALVHYGVLAPSRERVIQGRKLHAF